MFDKMKLALSWVFWPLTYATMFLFSYTVNIHTYYEDNGFSVKRPLILISNHRSIFDPWYISFAMPFKILFGRIFPLRPYSAVELSEKSSLARVLKAVGIMKIIYFVYNTITIPNGHTFDEKILPLVESLKKNQSVLMFPEGKLVSGESISDFKKGVVRLHQITGALILPVAIRYEKKASIFRKVNVAIGKPFDIPEEFINASSDEFTNARNYIRGKVEALYEKI